jgi:2-deoxy-D-gluconate 3-dehydrogenase
MAATRYTDRFGLVGNRVVVSGASQGLGRGIALAAVSAGADVVGIARSEEGLRTTQSMAADLPGRFEYIAADLAGQTELDRLVARVWEGGRITDVVHAAGVQVRKPAVEVTREDWRRVSAIHSETPFFLSTSIARLQLGQKVKGCHLFVGSLTSWIGLPNIAPYAASKSGLLGLTRTLAVEWAPFGIRVNALCPGYFHTAMTDDLLSDPQSRECLLARIPMRRLGVVEDLAGAAVFLLSPAASYITGQVVNVDGGWLAG